MLLGTLLVTVFYLALNAVFVSAAPVTEIANKKEVAAISAKALGGSSVEFMIRVAIGLGTLSSVAGMIMTGPRVFSRMADDGLFPSFFASGAKSIPRTVLLQSVIAATLVLVSNLEALLGYLSTTLALSSAATVATLFIRSKDDSTRPSLFVSANAGLYFVSTVVIAVLMVINDYRDLAATFYTVVIGSILWVIFSGQRIDKPKV
jgi:APA family basic amino acid/polyamine antiporter